LFFGALFEALDSLLGYDDQFKLQYATGESSLDWKKRGLIPKDSKSKDLPPASKLCSSARRENRKGARLPAGRLSYLNT
jgi:hypothetical protein